MTLLLFSDLHCDLDKAQSLVERSREVDAVIGAGDMATKRRGLEQTVEVLRQITCPTLLVAGNAETHDELRIACDGWEAAHVLHGSQSTVREVTFFGLGSAVPVTPFGSWSFDTTEEDARILLASCPHRAVLISHSPPHGAADRDASGQSLGSHAVREAVERCHPRLVVCGHIHASWERVDHINDTPVVNAGPDGIVWQLE